MRDIFRKNKNAGQLLIQVIVYSSIATILLGGLLNWAAGSLLASRYAVSREQALQIAEAGIDYYRWHLAHAPVDFQDGTGQPGPYVHTFYDINGNALGTYTLNITQPATGTTVVLIKSTGTVASSTINRSIAAKFAIPSFAKYAFVTNSVVYYGSGDKVYGPIHSNVGVGFLSGSPQPIAYNVVTSAASTFNDGYSCGSGTTHFGVYTCVPTIDPAPPAPVPTRSDVFQGGRIFPVPAVDFTSITSDLSSIKTQAQTASGFYAAASGALGYKVVLQTNGTFTLYKVNSLLAAPSGCSNSQSQTGWGTWSIAAGGGATTLIGTYPYPANGLMFFEDNVWVEGQINTNRLTIAAGAFPVNPATYKNIIVNNNLTYTHFDGTDVLALIAQGNFLVGMASADNLTIDGAVIAQNGQTIRYYYSNKCSPYTYRTTLTTYGMFASNGQGYFYYGNSGYQNQPASYDANLLYGPPPSFPLTGNQYQLISWQEVQ